MGIGVLSLLGISAFVGIGARTRDIPTAYALSDATLKQGAGEQARIRALLESAFGTPEDPRMPPEACAGLGVSPGRLKRGRDFYRRQCMHCHGVTGDGQGPTAKWLVPSPRDYRPGIFKITSTAIGVKPSRRDLLRTIQNGMPGTYMPAFGLYDDETLGAALDYVLHLSVRGNVERLLALAAEEGEDLDEEAFAEQMETVIAKWKEAEERKVSPKVSRPGPTPESVGKGKDLFLSEKTNCKGCHGEDGTGRGLAAKNMENDAWGNKTLPANLRDGVYRGGSRPLDLWERIYAGVKGTPMPGFGENLTEEEIWHLVNYLQSIAERPEGRAR